MIYAQLSLYVWYYAFVTAESHACFLKVFGEIINDCIRQYENHFLTDIGAERRAAITEEFERIKENPPASFENMVSDLKLDENGYELDELFK
ncbi:MAG: hypothetical protein WC340_02565 [Kiritimatiellia bacterium]